METKHVQYIATWKKIKQIETPDKIVRSSKTSSN